MTSSSNLEMGLLDHGVASLSPLPRPSGGSRLAWSLSGNEALPVDPAPLPSPHSPLPPGSMRLSSLKVATSIALSDSMTDSSAPPSPSPRRDPENPDVKHLIRQHPPPHSSASFLRRYSTSLKHIAFGDDLDIEDRWLSSSFQRSSQGRDSNVVVPDVPQTAEELLHWSTHLAGHEGGSPASGLRTLMWYYLQTFLYSVVVALPVLPLVYLLSLVPWHVTNPDPSAEPVYMPNHSAVQWALFMQCVFSLALYGVVLYMAMMQTFVVPRPLIIASGAVIAYALIAVSLFWHFNVPVWFYYLDVVLIATSFLPVICMVGWLAAGPNATLKQRVDEVLFVAMLEVLVAVATLIYTTFLMPLFFTLTSAWLQLLWICVIHPLYFEVTTAAVVRKALHRQVALGRTAIVNFLPIVHAMVHMVGLGISLMASIEPTHIMIVSVLIYNLGKLMWRSTVLWRDLLVERIMRRDWSFNYEPESRIALCQLISLSVLTELILENSAIISAPFMLWCMYQEPIFMTIVPNTFFYSNGKYPVKTLFAMIGIMFSCTWLCDCGFFALNYYYGQKLPIIHTWRKIKEGKWAYLGFLTYALATMGVMFSFSMMLILPRAAYCRSDNYCDCVLPAYNAVCKGEYISMMVDYLVGGPGN